uniref:Uncharacterized protein n=1 Tax=Brassica oleracea var. oleracea TaxID=109376 RepID=A0A0D3CQ25_BRAOL
MFSCSHLSLQPESSSSKEEFARGEARHGQDFVATLAAVTFSLRDGNGLHTGLVMLSSHVFATSTAEASRKFSESSSSVTVLSSFVLLRIISVLVEDLRVLDELFGVLEVIRAQKELSRSLEPNM